MLLGLQVRRAAVIDIGSNTANLAVFGLDGSGGLECIAEHDEPLRLLHALDPDGSLPESAVDEVLEILEDFLREASMLDADAVEVVATSALRDAPNRETLARRIEGRLGLRLQVLEGEEEGRCAAHAALHSLPLVDGFVMDLGGGSLQLAKIEGGRIAEVASLPLGALRLALRFPFGDPPDHAAVTGMRREIQARLAEVPWLRGGGTLVGIGGTVRTLARIDRRARQWAIAHGHGYRLAADAVESIWELVSRVPEAHREHIPGLPGHRVDLIVPGALVVAWLLRVGGFEALRVCNQGVREGVLLRHAAAAPTGGRMREAGLAVRFGAAPQEAERAAVQRDAALALFDALEHLGLPAELRDVVSAAGWLGGLWSQRTAGPGVLASLLGEPMPGWWQEEVLAIADLLSPVPRLQLEPTVRERLRLVLDLAATRPLERATVGLEGVRLAVRGRVHVETTHRFERAFGRPLRVERSKAAEVEPRVLAD